METITVIKDGAVIFNARVTTDLAKKVQDFAKKLGGDKVQSTFDKNRKGEDKKAEKKEEKEPLPESEADSDFE